MKCYVTITKSDLKENGKGMRKEDFEGGLNRSIERMDWKVMNEERRESPRETSGIESNNIIPYSLSLISSSFESLRYAIASLFSSHSYEIRDCN